MIRNGLLVFMSNRVLVSVASADGASQEGSRAVVEWDGGASDVAQRIADELRLLGHEAGSLVCLLESDQCLAVSWGLADVAERRGSALLYRLEEYVPFEAEQMASAFSVSDRSVFTCAVPPSRLRKVLARLADSGYRIETVVPVMIEATAGIVRSLEGSALPDAVVWRRDDAIEVVCLVDHLPVAWARWAAGSDGWFRTTMARWGTFEPRAMSICAIGMSRGELDTMSSHDGVVVHEYDAEPLAVAATGAAERLLSGERVSWDLAPSLLGRSPAGPLRKQPAFQIGVSLVIGLLCLAASGFIRGRQLEGIREEIDTAKVESYRSAFPDEAVPRGIEKSLEARLQALQDPASLGAKPENARSALATLLDVLRGMAGQRGYHINLVRVDGSTVELRGRAPDVGMAGAIASRLRKNGFRASVPLDGKGFIVRGEHVGSQGRMGE